MSCQAHNCLWHLVYFQTWQGVHLLLLLALLSNLKSLSSFSPPFASWALNKKDYKFSDFICWIIIFAWILCTNAGLSNVIVLWYHISIFVDFGVLLDGGMGWDLREREEDVIFFKKIILHVSLSHQVWCKCQLLSPTINFTKFDWRVKFLVDLVIL